MSVELLGNANIGKIQPNMTSDLVVVNGNPILDISLLETNVAFVLKGRHIIRNESCK